MLSTESLKKIDQEIAKYPLDKRQSAVMSTLAIAQEEKGWLADETINFVAEYLNMYNLEPMGKCKITVCTNLPCALSGSNESAAYLKKKLGIEFNQTTSDGKFTLKEGECFGACGDAPVLLVNNKRMCSFMSNEMIDKLLEELSK